MAFSCVGDLTWQLLASFHGLTHTSKPEKWNTGLHVLWFTYNLVLLLTGLTVSKESGIMVYAFEQARYGRRQKFREF